jgi:hypothetical protein
MSEATAVEPIALLLGITRPLDPDSEAVCIAALARIAERDASAVRQTSIYQNNLLIRSRLDEAFRELQRPSQLSTDTAIDGGGHILQPPIDASGAGSPPRTSN